MIEKSYASWTESNHVANEVLGENNYIKLPKKQPKRTSPGACSFVTLDCSYKKDSHIPLETEKTYILVPVTSNPTEAATIRNMKTSKHCS